MARMAIPITTLYGSKNPANPGIAPGITVDELNDHEWLFQSGDILVFIHSDAGTKAITLVGTADPMGRIEDAVISVTAGVYPIGPLNAEGWVQPDGMVYVDSTDIGSITLYVLRGARTR